MKTLDLQAAAELVFLDPSTLRAKAKRGEVPAAKPGKCWVFIDVDLLDWLRGLYTAPRQVASQPTPEDLCQPSSLKKPDQTTGITNLALMEKQYTNLLAPKTKPRRKK
jgi:hypothetical protein